MCFFYQQLDGDVEKVDSMNNDLDVDKQQCEMVKVDVRERQYKT